MGGQMSRKMGERAAPEAELEGKSRFCVELSADVGNLDGLLQERQGCVIHTVGNGVQVDSLSVESLKQVMTYLHSLTVESLKEVETCLLEMDQQAVKEATLQFEFEFVQEYLDNSLVTLDFYVFLKNSLGSIENDHLMIQLALLRFSTEGEAWLLGEEECRKVLKEIGKFKSAGRPFPKDFWHHFEAVYQRHIHMMEKLHARRSKVDKKLKHKRTWHKISSIILVAKYMLRGSCCHGGRPGCGGGESHRVHGNVDEFPAKKVRGHYQGPGEGYQRDTPGTFVTIKDMDTIRVLVDRLEGTLSSMLRSVEFCLRDRVAVQVLIQDIEKKEQSFLKDIVDLVEHVDSWWGDILNARTLFMDKIVRRK